MEKKKTERETRNMYEPYQQTTSTEHQVPGFRQIQTNTEGIKVKFKIKFKIEVNLHPT